MRLTCPNCDAQYEVPDSAIPAGGRDVQCSNCGHFWYQMPPGEADDAADDPADDAALAAALDTTPDEDSADSVAASIERALAAPPEAPEAPEAPAPQPDPAPPPAPDPAPDLDDDPEEAPAAAPPPRATPLDESLVALLKEEAERELEARRAEARRQENRMPETQGDLGLAPPDDSRDRARRLATLHGDDPDPAPARPAARRDLLPDVESINSSLQTSGAEPREADPVADLPDLTQPRRGFRSGFTLVMVLAVLGAVAYAAAPQLKAQFPAAAPTVDSYVATVNDLRQWMDGMMIRATSALSDKDAP